VHRTSRRAATTTAAVALLALGVTGAASASRPDPDGPAPSTSVSPLSHVAPVTTIRPKPEPKPTSTPRPTPTPSRTPSPTPTPAPAPVAVPPPTLDFRLTSFNVLGASHTAGKGKRPGMASGVVRAGRAAVLIRRHGSDVVGFQELQGSQLAALKRQTNLDFYPGFTMRHQDTENSIGWRSDRWVAIERHTVRIPYFNGGLRAMPVVRLRSLSTGLEAWFANFHNPAETATYHHQQRYRVEATNIEIALANRLISTGLPVFITGDMNERAPYFCRLTAHTPMIAARGGTNIGRCQPGRPRAVDWIFGSQGVEFSGYTEDRSHLVDITTDHPVVTAQVHIVGQPTG
jgi:hypothetical protein